MEQFILNLQTFVFDEFEDLVLKENDNGALELAPVIHEMKVFEKIFLDLQD